MVAEPKNPMDPEPQSPTALALNLSGRLRALGSLTRAKGAQAYMKTTDPFFGVAAPMLRAMLRELRATYRPRDQALYLAQVEALWALPEREAKYAAIEWARTFQPFITLAALPLYERMIRSGRWWDSVDAIAAHLVGRLLLGHRNELKPVIEAWSQDPDLWIRRTALLAHLKHKGATDEVQLFEFCLRLAPEKDFFIRKAIGWALREYSKTAPHAVESFLENHRERWAGLTYREARKRLATQGLHPPASPARPRD